MLLEVKVGGREAEDSFLIKLEEGLREFEEVLPFRSKANLWKHEIYFETPVESVRGEAVYRNEAGSVYFWPPGRALCVFYGYSHAYTPVVYVGKLVDPFQRVSSVPDSVELEVVRHVPDETYAGEVKVLEELGFAAGTPLDEGVRVITALKVVGNVRVSLTIFREDYGYHVESEALGVFADDLPSLKVLSQLKNLVEAGSKFLRLDVTEEDLVAITAGIEKDLSKLKEVVKELELAVLKIRRTYLPY